jgi:signal transduction histidine kinase/CheY-like chemotaxis protein/peptide methionine sulfoxide reductase MsrB
VFIAAFFIYGAIQYYLVKESLSTGIESELNNTTQIILGMVEANTETAIRSYLRAIAEKNLEIVQDLYASYKRGEISEKQARDRAVKIFFSQKIGRTGYIYCVNSMGIAVIHPKKGVQGTDYSHFKFVQQQMKEKEGYIQYEWKNPGEKQERPKALYMTYFKPWDLIISASTYREEFIHLVKVEDFRDKILSLRFGQTGYSYILDSKGNLFIHPVLTGNVMNAKSSNGYEFIKEMCARKSGKIIYSWKNPDETVERDKLVIYNYIKDLDWIVASSSYIEEFYQPLSILRKVYMAGSLITIILLVIVNFALSSYITAPLITIVKKFKEASSGNYPAAMPESGNDELGDMAHYFNLFIQGLSELKEKDDQLIRMQKMEAIWQLAGGLAHDFNNMLGGIMGSVSLLQYYAKKDFTGNEAKIINLFNTIENATLRAADLVNRLLIMSRAGEMQRIPVDLSTALRNVISICSNTFDKMIEIKVTYPEKELWVAGDPTQLEQIILNICINAEHAMTIMKSQDEGRGGILTLSITGIQGDKALCEMYHGARMIRYAVLEISDTGIGMNSEIQKKIFDPFFTTKGSGLGTGLGLSIVYTIISQLGGFITVQSHEGKGTIFRIYLPEIEHETSTEEKKEETVKIQGSGLILVIDDEEMIRNTARSILMDHGYEVITAPGGNEGLEIYRKRHSDIHTVLLDMGMPGMNGREIFLEMQKIDSNARVILCSGLRMDNYLEKVLNLGFADFLHKPFNMNELLRKVAGTDSK